MVWVIGQPNPNRSPHKMSRDFYIRHERLTTHAESGPGHALFIALERIITKQTSN